MKLLVIHMWKLQNVIQTIIGLQKYKGCELSLQYEKQKYACKNYNYINKK